MATSRPVGDALDLLGRRWATPDLGAAAQRLLSELRESTGIGQSVLSARLGELVESGVVEQDGGGALPG